MPSKTDWSKVKREYVTKNISLKDLAEKYNISYNEVMRHSSQEKWKAQKKEYVQKLDRKVTEKTLEKTAQKDADDEELITNLKSEIRKLAFMRVYKALSDPLTDGQDTRRAIQNFKDMIEIEPGGLGEEYEDDGLLTALADKVEDVFAEGDDSNLIGGD